MFPTRLPFLRRRNPYRNNFRPLVFQPNWSFPSNFRSSHYGLYRYLPLLVQAAYQYAMSIEETCYLLATSSDGIHENGSFPGLDARALLGAYTDLVQVIEICRNRHDVHRYIRLQLLASLNGSSQPFTRRFWRRQDCSPPWLFRVYAEISGQTKSRPIAEILNEFFQMHVHSIISNDIEDLAIWSHSICRSAMHDDDKEACLAPIVESCPELINELKALRLRPAKDLWPVLEEIARALGIKDVIRGGRSRPWSRNNSGRNRIRPPSRDRQKALRWGGTVSTSSSPDRGSTISSISPFPNRDVIPRPLTAPGHRSIVEQADRVIDLVENTMDEAHRLKAMAGG